MKKVSKWLKRLLFKLDFALLRVRIRTMRFFSVRRGDAEQFDEDLRQCLTVVFAELARTEPKVLEQMEREMGKHGPVWRERVERHLYLTGQEKAAPNFLPDHL